MQKRIGHAPDHTALRVKLGRCSGLQTTDSGKWGEWERRRRMQTEGRGPMPIPAVTQRPPLFSASSAQCEHRPLTSFGPHWVLITLPILWTAKMVAALHLKIICKVKINIKTWELIFPMFLAKNYLGLWVKSFVGWLVLLAALAPQFS